MDILSQKTMPWGNILLGSSKYYIHAYGAALTVLSEILGITPDEANAKLNSVSGFGPDATGELDQIIWEKIVPAFPGWSAQYIEPYNNETVLDALSKGQFVIVLTSGEPVYQTDGFLHAVRYMGNGVCHDPQSGTERPTNDFPDVKAMVILTKLVQEATMPAPEATPTLAQETVSDGTAEIAPEVPVAEQPASSEQPAPVEQPAETPPATPESHVDPAPLAVTLANLPQHEKEALIQQVENALAEIKKLLGL